MTHYLGNRALDKAAERLCLKPLIPWIAYSANLGISEKRPPCAPAMGFFIINAAVNIKCGGIMRVCFYIDGFNLYHKIAELPQKSAPNKNCDGLIFMLWPRNCAYRRRSSWFPFIIFLL